MSESSTDPTVTPPQEPSRWRPLLSPLPWLTLLISLGLTLVAAHSVQQSAQAKSQEQFERKVDELVAVIDHRLSAYRAVLFGFSGLARAHGHVVRDHWETYFNSLFLDAYFPGIQGVGFARLLDEGDIAEYEQSIRAQGFDQFAVNPPGPREVMTAIEILLPFDQRNQRAHGYDMYSNPVRREAMQKARETGMTVISGKVRLVQETHEDIQPGFLMYLALYNKSAPLDDSLPKQEQFLGWVYAPFRAHDLMHGIFAKQVTGVQFAVYDQAPVPQSLLYRSSGAKPVKNAQYKAQRVVEVGERIWYLEASSLPSFNAHQSHAVGLSILLAGLAGSAGLFFMAVGHVATRREASLKASLLRDKELSEKRMSIILNSTTTALVVVDTEGNIIEANRQATELFGYSLATLLSMKVEALIPVKYREQHKMHRRGYVGNPQKKEMAARQDLYAQNIRGEKIPVEIGLSPIKTENGLQVLATITDIRERLAEKYEKERILEQLSAKNVEMEQFVYTVSHDLKSPLVTINGFSKLLKDSLLGQMNEDQQHWLNRIEHNVKSMEALLNDLLELSRIIHRELEPEPMDLQEVVQEVQAALSGQIKSSGAQISVDLTERRLVGHRRLVIQCLQNLISNAIQYRKSDEPCHVSVRSVKDGNWIVISVEDNGIGIDSTYHNRIFEIFERLSTKASAGTGVGLAVVKTAMEKHNGYAAVHSELGFGATFELHFPNRRAE